MPLDLVQLKGPLTAWAARWRVREVSIFGSALRHDFGPDSDVDVLVEFSADHDDAAMDALTAELEAIVARPVDLVEKRLLRNPFIRFEVLSERRVVYAA